MTAEKVEETAEEKNLAALREKLPYQYASIISKRLKLREDIKEAITPAQIRLVLYDQNKNPDIAIPVLEEAWKLYEEMKKLTALTQRETE